MKKLLILTLLFAALHTSAQIQFTAGINYESGVPSGAPSSTGSRLRVDLASGRIYQWSAANTTWRTLGQGIDIVAGCAAPAYTPGYAQSVFAVNGCNTPELYYYNGTQWKQVAGGGGGGTTYYAGTGIDIDANDTISIDTVPRLIFYSDQTYSGGVGAMRWNNDDGTLDLGLKGGNVTLQLGQELVQPVKHATNGGLDNGKVVYIVGSSGDNKTVLYARANDEATSANTLGLMTETVTGGNKGFCTTFGLVRNINTSNLTEGGAVWLSKDTAGAMTAVRPEAPNNGVFIGFCVRKHASTGVIFVNVQNGYELEELHNVYAPSPTNSQVLTYVSANSRWEAATVADQSATNELQTLSVATNTATLSNSGGSVTIAGGGINTVGTAGSTITVTGTEVDGSISNELQTIDTFSLSGQTLRASLSSDNQAAKTVTLPVVGITAGTNVTVSSTGGNFTINSTGGGGGTPAGSTGEVQFNNAGAFGASSNLFWNNAAAPTGQRLGIGTTSPGARLQIVGLGATSSTSSFLVQNSTPAESFVIRDDRSWAFSANGAINSINIGRGGGNQSTNLAFGASALNANTTGNNNAGIGSSALVTCTTGSFNVAIGNNALNTNNNNYNTAIGYRPAYSSTGTEVTAIGVESGFTNTSGNFWTAIGSTAGYSSTTGSNWVAIGYQSGRQNTTGGDWVAIGYQAARFQADGSTASQFFRNSTYIGSGTRATNGTAGSLTSNETVIGYQAAGLGTNSTVIGNSSTTRTHFFGNTTIGGTTASAFTPLARLHVLAAGALPGTDAFIVQNSTPSTLFDIENNGKITYWATNTATGTTAVQTINRPSGTINIAAGETSKDVNNSLCTTSSIILPVIRTNDATATIKNVVPGNGSFTINLTAAATAETSVGFFIIN